MDNVAQRRTARNREVRELIATDLLAMTSWPGMPQFTYQLMHEGIVQALALGVYHEPTWEWLQTQIFYDTARKVWRLVLCTRCQVNDRTQGSLCDKCIEGDGLGETNAANSREK